MVRPKRLVEVDLASDPDKVAMDAIVPGLAEPAALRSASRVE
jgi:hypothetical protein